MNRRMKKMCMMTGVVLVLLVLVALCFKITATARVRFERQELLNYCREQEKRLVGEVRDYLSDQGYRDSGVTLTRTCYEDGSMQYRLKVHHGRIDAMEESEREALLAELSAFTFPMDRCTFVQEFFIN